MISSMKKVAVKKMYYFSYYSLLYANGVDESSNFLPPNIV